MDVLSSSILVLLLLAIAAYAQTRIPAFTRGRGKIAATRLLLVLVGIGFGSTMTFYMPDRTMQILAFLGGFGAVHVPAAIILFLKGRRGEGHS